MQRFAKFFLGLLSLFFFISIHSPAFAQTTPQNLFMKAMIIRYQSPSQNTGKSQLTPINPLQARILDGAEKGKVVSITYDPSSTPGYAIHTGDTIVVGEVTKVTGEKAYYLVDQDRSFPVVLVLIGFVLLTLLIAGKKGIGSLLGSFISLGVIFLYIIPQIINGADPLTVCMIGAVGILFVTTYIAHGISKQSTIALLSTLIALGITYFLAQYIAQITLLTGYGDEQAATLRFGLKHVINIRDLLLGGVILATLGALNDITITQAAAIFALHRQNPNLSFKQLAAEGFTIGREHAVSLVNTLVLAYAGASLSLFIFFLYNPNQMPLWVILNSEFLVEEVMKIIAGTSGLLFSVPIVTFLASALCKKKILGFIGDFIYAYIH